MPDETGTEAARSDAPSANESLFGDTADDAAAAVAEEQDANEETQQDPQDADDAGGPEGRRVHQGREGHHRGATAVVGPAHRDLR